MTPKNDRKRRPRPAVVAAIYAGVMIVLAVAAGAWFAEDAMPAGPARLVGANTALRYCADQADILGLCTAAFEEFDIETQMMPPPPSGLGEIQMSWKNDGTRFVVSSSLIRVDNGRKIAISGSPAFSCSPAGTRVCSATGNWGPGDVDALAIDGSTRDAMQYVHPAINVSLEFAQERDQIMTDVSRRGLPGWGIDIAALNKPQQEYFRRFIAIEMNSSSAPSKN